VSESVYVRERGLESGMFVDPGRERERECARARERERERE
jgi:hypothetical protein